MLCRFLSIFGCVVVLLGTIVVSHYKSFGKESKSLDPTDSTLSVSEPGFMVLAPDRGFLGNEEVRDIFTEFRKYVPNAVLAFATKEKTVENLRQALATLSEGKDISCV